MSASKSETPLSAGIPAVNNHEGAITVVFDLVEPLVALGRLVH
jgi:hypothetical protein